MTSSPRLSVKRADFGDAFTFGVATSSYQIEGHTFGGAGPTHWDTFAATAGNVVRAEDGAVACDHYHRWEEDLDLIRDAGLSAYRFSTSWARIMPEGRGAVNAEGLDFYDRLVDGMLARGLQPHATLYHWELPAALADLGGWTNRDVANWFADFTEVVIGRLGDRLTSVAPVNEPWCVSFLSHFLGIHAPGHRDIRATARAMHHVLLAHGRSIAAMRAMGQTNLGAVNNFEYVSAADESEASRAAARLYEGIYNRWFVQAMMQKTYPEDVLDLLGPHMPAGWEADLDLIGAPLDWFGVNYYTRQNLRATDSPIFPAMEPAPGDLPKTAMGWEVFPEGLYRILTWLKAEQTGDLPIRITENGLASYDTVGPDGVSDPQRLDYLDGHLKAVLRAKAEGVPVEAYFAWSLMDNYEWAEGYEKRFGLVHVDFDTLERTPKDSYHALKAMLAG
ncbi:GH1 family beta-glucosidase [Oceanomicrobium pacificus]|uniref:Beta-glucosidase n=1 Tax=Oceanomicrobium pacificus TaxID=2692916 RepID=A0A6B0TT67_9RHOB|nr:GH1 family beta-glucosidase [Oceanomicrobium pacificus]MXU64183.1 beta-glucosidase [Oceanomicrobium pacificus]